MGVFKNLNRFKALSATGVTHHSRNTKVQVHWHKQQQQQNLKGT